MKQLLLTWWPQPSGNKVSCAPRVNCEGGATILEVLGRVNSAASRSTGTAVVPPAMSAKR
jgi:hypothetical protein